MSLFVLPIEHEGSPHAIVVEPDHESERHEFPDPGYPVYICALVDRDGRQVDSLAGILGPTPQFAAEFYRGEI